MSIIFYSFFVIFLQFNKYLGILMDPEHKQEQLHDNAPAPDTHQKVSDAPHQSATKPDTVDTNKKLAQQKVEKKVDVPEKIQQKKEVEKPKEQAQTKKVEQSKETTSTGQKKQQKIQPPTKSDTKAETKIEEGKSGDKGKTMKCVTLVGPCKVQVKQVPIPKPAYGQVLIKVMAAPINPSDLALYDGHYSQQKKFPTIMGFQGSGIVVENGGGVMGWGLVNKKVAFGAEKQGQGSYAQYIVAKCEECLPLTDETSFEQGAMSVINPLTALGMLDLLKQRKQKCVVITAAASALGRMINRFFPKEGVEVINIVRRAEQVELLKKEEGAKYVLNSSEQNFETELRVLAQKMGAKTCFEAIGGDFTAVIVKNMPKDSIITVYGCLSQKNISGIEVMDLLFSNKTINSFMLVQWLHSKNQLTLLPIFYKVRSSITQNLKSVVSKKFKLEQINEAIKYYLSNMTEGKVLMQPWSS